MCVCVKKAINHFSREREKKKFFSFYDLWVGRSVGRCCCGSTTMMIIGFSTQKFFFSYIQNCKKIKLACNNNNFGSFVNFFSIHSFVLTIWMNRKSFFPFLSLCVCVCGYYDDHDHHLMRSSENLLCGISFFFSSVLFCLIHIYHHTHTHTITDE